MRSHFRSLGADRRRIVHEEVSRTTVSVVRIGDLGCRGTSLERLASHCFACLVSEATRVQVRAVIDPALLPTERSGAALAPASSVATFDSSSCLAHQTAAGWFARATFARAAVPRTTASRATIPGSAASAAISRVAAACATTTAIRHCRIAAG